MIARSSSFVFKVKRPDARQAARDLSARYIIEGDVRKSDRQVRVTAQLIDGETGHLVWAEKYDSPIGDIFRIQDEITQCLVSSIEPQIELTERNRTKKSSPRT